MAVQPNQQLTLDTSLQKGFVSFFKSLSEKPDTTIRFFNRGDYYTVHGSDAVFAGKEVFKTSSVIKFIGSETNKTESLVLSKPNFESFIRDLLLVKQYRVEVYISKGSGKNSNDWTLEYKGSPGNLLQFEDMLFTSGDLVVGTSVIAVKLGGESKSRVVGLGFVDVGDQKMCVCEFPDDEHFSNLEALVVQLGPKECLLPSGDTSQEYNGIKKVVERGGALITPKKKTEFSTDELAQDLNRLLKFKTGQQQNSMALPETNLKIATAALSALIKYLELPSDQTNFGQFSLSMMDQNRFVHMDAAAVRALSLLPPPGSNSTNHSQYVLGLLDNCRTPQGHRLLAQWIKQPLKDAKAICERHNIVAAFIENKELRNSLYQEHLRRIPDLQALAKRLYRKKANMQDCYRIYQAVGRLPHLLTVLDQDDCCPTVKGVFVEPLSEILGDMLKFQEMVESTLDMDLVDRGEFLIKPTFDDDLQELRNTMDRLEEKIKKELANAAKDLSLEAHKGIKLESSGQLGYYFRITLKEERILRNNKKYEIVDTNKNGIRFRNSTLGDVNHDYKQARDQYTEHQKAVVTEIVGIAGGYVNTIQQLSDTLARLDVLTSFAEVAATAQIPYVRPIIHEEGEGILNLKQVRHPCLEVQEGVSYIANDVYFKQGDCTFHIITGPNMGGKSTYIKSVGIVVLLAQLGSFVPCDQAEMTLVDAILARVGADDCQMKGMSTFMMEMVETAAILRTATSKSLVIIDELGRGTSTYEGCGIAWAIAEHLARDVKAFSLFATHFHELTRLSEEIPTLVNQHVTAVTSQNTLTLMYQVKPGICDQSFGIHVAEMARFPPHVVEFAKKKQAELEDYQGLSFDCEPTEKKRIIQEGEEIIINFLDQCKKLNAENCNEEELAERLEQLKKEVQAKKNPYVETLLTQTDITI